MKLLFNVTFKLTRMTRMGVWMLTFGTLSEWIFHLANLSVETVSINITINYFLNDFFLNFNFNQNYSSIKY